jgi:hypothetical protein
MKLIEFSNSRNSDVNSFILCNIYISLGKGVNRLESLREKGYRLQNSKRVLAREWKNQKEEVEK